MTRYTTTLILLMMLITSSTAFAQSGESPIKIFGYFQNQFKYEGNPRNNEQTNSFIMQQLNLFLQKDLAKNWSAFVNFEIVNNYSSSRQWGSFNLEEAWVKYRNNKHFQLRLGLQVPTFNHLNRIKNRTPALPYIIRPLVYETSFEEFISFNEYLPSRAFVQAYGVIPSHEIKFDYAFFLGNSPNISSLDNLGQSGIDTTATVLFGGRVGIRFKELKVGFSAAYDRVNHFQNLATQLGEQPSEFEEIPRIRLGTDLLYNWGPISFAGEYIHVVYNERTETIDVDKEFYYATIGWRIIDNLFVYGSYWRTKAHSNTRILDPGHDKIHKYLAGVESPSFGAAYNLNDRIVLKGQFVNIGRTSDSPLIPSGRGFNIYSLAVSVNF
jgi:hypothetical protein